MMRLNLMLLLGLVLSAMYLVSVQYDSRRVFVDLEKAQNEAKRLSAEQSRLEVEKRAQATPLRVEKLAKEKLQMQGAGAGVTQYVTVPASGNGGKP